MQVFARAADTYLRLAFLLFVLLVVGGLLVAGGVVRSEWMTGASFVVTQPVPFSHKHHVGRLGIDCRYCHTAVETSASAGLAADPHLHDLPFADLDRCADAGAGAREPSRDKPMALEPRRRLPDYVYFDHSIHVALRRRAASTATVGSTRCR